MDTIDSKIPFIFCMGSGFHGICCFASTGGFERSNRGWHFEKSSMGHNDDVAMPSCDSLPLGGPAPSVRRHDEEDDAVYAQGIDAGIAVDG